MKKEELKNSFILCKNKAKEFCQKHPIIVGGVALCITGIIGYKIKGAIDSKRIAEMNYRISDLKKVCRIKDACHLETLLECAEEGSCSAIPKLYEFADYMKYEI